MENKTLADRIEDYIKWLLRDSGGIVELQRQELAGRFTCVPSQITYVLSTRFTMERGYIVESRRGGGGYVRVARLPLSAEQRFGEWVHVALGEGMTPEAAAGLLERLAEEGLLTRREQRLLAAALSRPALALEPAQADRVRASIVKAVLLNMMLDDFPDPED